MGYDPSIVSQYLFSSELIGGVWITLELSVLAQIIGIVLGTIMALGRTARNPLFYLPANLYIWFFRGTPVLVQILFWYAALSRVGPFYVGLLALSLNEGAYMAEIMRAGIEAVDKGQMEAAQSLGMTFGLAMRRIILPQAARVIIPPTGNEFISMLKTSSLVGAASLDELLLRTQRIYSSADIISVPGAFHPLELLTVASIYYLVLTTIFSIGQAWLENRLGDRRAASRRSARAWMTSVLSLGGAVQR